MQELFKWLVDLVIGAVVLMVEVVIAHGAVGSGRKCTLARAALSFVGGAMIGLFSWLLWTGFFIHAPALRLANLCLGPIVAAAGVTGIVKLLRHDGMEDGSWWHAGSYVLLAYFACAGVRFWEGH
ncbi:MAG TPA: hypothetical protein VGM47_02035 [Gammaproteobacteria bacterium]